MKKDITKEQIIETALELMRDKNDLVSLNLREIARKLGCAHTNLYNYFSSYNDLLRETCVALQEIFLDMLAKRLEDASSPAVRLRCFFEAFADIYLDNPGWFRLLWQETICDERRDLRLQTALTNKRLTARISDIWHDLHEEIQNEENVKNALHITHCYIIGEVSNFLSGRGWLENEAALREHIAHGATRIFSLCLSEEVRV